jgi:Trypsin
MLKCILNEFTMQSDEHIRKNIDKDTFVRKRRTRMNSRLLISLISLRSFLIGRSSIMKFVIFLHACLAFGAFVFPEVNATECGKRSLVVGTVLGGDEARKNSWPWLAALFNRRYDNFFCAGSLISRKHVLSGKK